MELTEARKIAERLRDYLAPYCERIEIAGSIRRGKPEVGDIELVAIPKMLPIYDLFGEQSGEHSLLNDRGLFNPLGNIRKFGQHYVQVELLDGINLDLFIVSPPYCKKCGIIVSNTRYISGGNNALQKSRKTEGSESRSLSQSDLPENNEDLRDMRSRIRDWTSSGSTNLQQKMFGNSELENESGEGRKTREESLQGNLQELREEIPGERIHSKGMLLSEMRENVLGEEQDKQTSKMDRISGKDGMETGNDYRFGIHSSVFTRTSICDEKREDYGASIGNGKPSLSISGAVGNYPSSEWNKDRQSNREFGDCDTRSSKWVGDLSQLQSQVSSSLNNLCPRCKSNNLITPSWGVLFAIRTGPADFSHWLVTPRQKGGILPSGWRVEDGRVWDGQVTLDFPDEESLFKWVGLGWVDPGERRAGWGGR